MNVSFFNQTSGVFLEVEVNPNSADRFEKTYRDFTGSNPVLADGYQHQPNKWGMEVRVYFNCEGDLSDEFSAIDVYVEQGNRPYREQWKYRTNDREFFWTLVQNGYHLGQN